jgi:Tfp pilus assembly pilus retraction ATPase PilT
LIAALIEVVNTRRRDHILAGPDPIEYEHEQEPVVEQIEVGHDAELCRSGAGGDAADSQRN